MAPLLHKSQSWCISTGHFATLLNSVSASLSSAALPPLLPSSLPSPSTQQASLQHENELNLILRLLSTSYLLNIARLHCSSTWSPFPQYKLFLLSPMSRHLSPCSLLWFSFPFSLPTVVIFTWLFFFSFQLYCVFLPSFCSDILHTCTKDSCGAQVYCSVSRAKSETKPKSSVSSATSASGCFMTDSSTTKTRRILTSSSARWPVRSFCLHKSFWCPTLTRSQTCGAIFPIFHPPGLTLPVSHHARQVFLHWLGAIILCDWAYYIWRLY